jgi:tetraacyldisaccharide-1-P 4'-kinase
MVCYTQNKDHKDGQRLLKPKRAFNTLDDAIAEAKKLNLLSDHTQKLVAYKCTDCYKYHIGKNGKVITEKEKFKLKREKDLSISFKILGKIDLANIR